MDLLAEQTFRRHAQDLRGMWQVRALIETKDKWVGAILLSVLAHNYDDAMPVLMRVAFPGFTSIKPPFLCSSGKIDKGGHIVADVVRSCGTIVKNRPLCASTAALQDLFRFLADRLKLTDAERKELFIAVQRWVVADTRLDPTMDPKDPDAKRLRLH